MERNTHILKPRRGTRYPTILAALAADYEYRKPTPDAITRDYWTTRACLTWYRRRGDSYSRIGQHEGTAESCHLELQRLCRPGAAVWLFADQCYRALIALGVFDAIDQETWTISGTDDGTGGSQQGSQRRACSGYCVVEDRTTILVVRRPRAGVLHAVDVANYAGRIERREGESLYERSHRVLEWARRWVALCHDHGLGTLQHTLAAQSWYAYRRRLPAVPVVVHAAVAATALERDTLYGGRCEAYQIGVCRSRGLDTTATSHYGGPVACWSGTGPLYHLDARSLYGAVASRTLIPHKLRGYEADESGGLALPDYPCIADVEIETDTPIVPLRVDKPALIIYPVGRYRTALAWPELERVRDRVVRCYRYAWYEQSDLFSAWAAFCWRLRLDTIRRGDTELIPTVKALGQVLYGKFAQRARGWKKHEAKGYRDRWGFWWEVDRESGLPYPVRVIGGKCERHHDGGETYDSSPVITATINSAARVWLWDLMCAAGRGEVVYCDTDSVIVTESGYDNLVNSGYVVGDGLGELRVVGVHETIEIVGVKHYVADGVVTCAGLPARSTGTRAVPGGTLAEEPLTSAAEKKRPPLAREVLRGLPTARVYRHGNVEPDGRVTPFVFGRT